MTYELLRRTFADDPEVEIIWDRRRPADAAPAAAPERRGRAPMEWQRLDYLYTSGRRPETPDTEPPDS